MYLFDACRSGCNFCLVAGLLQSVTLGRIPSPQPRSSRLSRCCFPPRSFPPACPPIEARSVDSTQLGPLDFAPHLIGEHFWLSRWAMASTPAVAETQIKAPRARIPGSYLVSRRGKSLATPASGSICPPSMAWSPDAPGHGQLFLPTSRLIFAWLLLPRCAVLHGGVISTVSHIHSSRVSLSGALSWLTFRALMRIRRYLVSS